MQINGLGTATPASPTDHDPATTPDRDFDWDVFAHHELLDETIGAILNGPGALLQGPRGVGKRSLAYAVMRALGERAFLVDLEHPERRRTSLEVAGRLHRVEGLGEEARFRELGVVKALLEARARGRHVVIFVPANLSLDAACVSFLSALALASSISLLCIGSGTGGAGSGRDLGTAVGLQVVTLQPLGLGMTRELLAKSLGAEISRAAAYQLWCASAGQIHMLAAVARDWREQGYLDFSENAWVVHGVAGPPGPRCRALVVQKLRKLSKPEQRVLRILAFSEEIPLSLLLALSPGDAVDALYAEGMLEIRGRYARKVRLRGELSGPCIAEDTPPGTAQALLEQMRSTPGAEGVLTPLVLLKWEQAAGIGSGAGLMLQAAEQAHSEGQPELCLQILEAFEEAPLAARLLRLEAAIRGGQLERAVEMHSQLRRQLGETVPAPGEHERSHSPIEEIRLSLASTVLGSLRADAPLEAFKAGIRRARADIDAWLENEPEDRTALLALGGQVDLLEAETFLRLGVPCESGKKTYIHPLLGGHEQLRWQCIQNLLAVRRGAARDGVRRGRELLSSLRQDQYDPAVGQGAKMHLVDLHLLSGDWRSGVELIDSAWFGGEESARITDTNGLYSSLNGLLGGHPRETLALLRVEIEQLRIVDPSGHLPLAIAAAAAAAAHLDREEAERHLAELDVIPEGGQWATGQLVALLRAEALYHLGIVDEAVAGLLAGTEASARHGDLALELLQRMSLLRMGHREADAQLLECAQAIDAPVAEVVAAFMRSLGDAGSDTQRETLNMLRRMGHAALVDSVEVMSVRTDYAVPRVSWQAASARAAAASGTLGRTSARNPLSLLTPRQRAIVAEAATGAGNREISERMQLKIRTVEGHLYQIYQRLNVGSREELIQMYRLATPGEKPGEGST